MTGSVAPPTPTIPRLALEDISCAFGSVLAVEHLSLSIMPGEFLGETWEYVVAPVESGQRLKITTSPIRVFDVGEKVWLEFDPQQMALNA